jgi:hypothetical protein
MKKIPTAEEMFDANPILPPGVTRNACIAFMKTFAKLHVEAALKAASKKAKITYEYSGNTGSEYCDEFVDIDSILNSYPLENII